MKNKICLAAIIIASTLYSGAIAAESKITTVYPANTSFKKIILSGNQYYCERAQKWSTEWKATSDTVLPVDVAVSGNFDEVVTKVYMSYFDNQNSEPSTKVITDNSWKFIQIVKYGCSIIVSDK